MGEYERMTSDHEYLRLLLDRMWALTAAPEDALPEERWKAVWERELNHLADVLTRHFRDEEQDGYMTDIVEMQPHLHERVMKLLEQHSTMIADLDLIMDLMHDHADTAARLRVVRLIEVLRAHERAETELVQRTLYRDTAAAD